MKFDGIEMLEGSIINNLTISSGLNYPDLPDIGELFYKINDGLYTFDGTSWKRIAINGADISTNNLIVEGEIHGPAILVIDPMIVGDNTGVVIIKGDLQVDGTTTTINSNTVLIDDKNIVIANGSTTAAEADGAGFTIEGANATLLYKSATDVLEINKPLLLPGNPTENSHAATKQYADNASFISGTRIPFAQPSAPLGWIQDTSDNANNRMLRVVNTTGNGIGGIHSPILNNVVPNHSHTFTSGTESSDHSHYISTSDPGNFINGSASVSIEGSAGVFGSASGVISLTGAVGGVTAGKFNFSSTFYRGFQISAGSHTHSALSQGSSTEHTHSGTTNAPTGGADWAPRYIDLIMCSKI